MKSHSSSTISATEIANFSVYAADWWNERGSFRPLHRLNPLRVEYIRDHICAAYERDSESFTPLQGLDILDVGCGGGLLCEPLARMGADVTGLDASSEAIDVARTHAAETGLSIVYKLGSAEVLANGKKRYDVVTALEIVEHVADLDVFIAAVTELLKPNGLLILSTLNRTPKSFLLGIVAAEYLLRWVPRGTHSWRKFIRPSELLARLEAKGMTVSDLSGMIFNPLTGAFDLSKNDYAVNYLVTAIRKAI